MSQELSPKHLSLLVALQEGPMDTIESLAERVGFSRTTVSQNLKWLSGELKTSKKSYYRVVPNLDEQALGLETADVFFETTDFETVKKIEDLCEKHPYTKFRARCFGHKAGLFAQFRIPSGTRATLLDTLEESVRKNGIGDVYFLPQWDSDPVTTIARLKSWNMQSLSWEFDWDDWTKLKVDTKRVPYPEPREPRLDELTRLDIKILFHLTKGARRKQKDIIKKLSEAGIEVSSQDFSRRIHVLRDAFMHGHMVFVDPETFHLYSSVVVTAKIRPDFGKSLHDRLLMHPIPFRSTLKVKDDFLFWYLRLPPTHLSDLLYILHREGTDIGLTILDYQRSEFYAPWSEAFDEDTHSWRTDRKFMSVK